MPLAEFRADLPILVERLLCSRRRGRTGHAYLFVGDDQAFLERFMDAWVQVCVCAAPLADGDACGTCANCGLVTSGNYPALHVVRPQSKSRRILIRNIRALEHDLDLAADRGHTKVAVLIEADCMNEEAQNAFLKTLEEPPPHTLLFLFTTRPRRLLPTIRSRCQTVSLRRNLRDYTPQIEAGLFTVLADLKPRAGAGAALAAASQLREAFSGLQADAEATMADQLDENWEALAEDDGALAQKLEEERVARTQADYLRRRQDLCDALQAWYLQQYLRASGVDVTRLPHPEILPDSVSAAPSIDDADRSIRLVERFLRTLEQNVPEALVIDAFCLELTRR